MPLQQLRIRLIAQLKKIGYPDIAAEQICNRLTTIANLYDQPKLAFEIIVQNMETKVSGPFSSHQFSTFVREISPNHTPWYLYEKKLGLSPDEVEILEPHEQDEYWREKLQLDQKLTAKRKADLSLLRSGQAWDILTSRNWREIQPSLGIYKEIKGGVIFTPLGGQPGFKRRTRRP